MSVVFPAPVLPTTAIFCPGFAAKLIFFISRRSGSQPKLTWEKEIVPLAFSRRAGAAGSGISSVPSSSSKVRLADASADCRELIIKAYGEYTDKTYDQDLETGGHIVCKSKVLDSVSLGYYKITVESPLLDEEGNKALKKGKAVADPSKRDTENVPLDEDIDAFFKREVLPYNPDAWVDKSKTKIGYEIPFTRTFYEYKEIEPAYQIAKRIEEHEHALMQKLHELFGKDGE